MKNTLPGIKPHLEVNVIRPIQKTVEPTSYNEGAEESKVLKQAGHQQVFQAPPGYFEKLPAEIASKISRPNGSGIYNRIPVRVMATLTCLGVIIAAGILFFRLPGDHEKASADFTYEDLYASGMYTQMDESLLMDVITVPGNTETEVIPAGSGTEEQHLQDYLIENNTDINLIISEL